MMTRKVRFLLLATAFITLAPAAWCQRYSDWRIYHASDGLPESSCVSVSVSGNGKVLVKHFNTDSVSELDGYSITPFSAPEVGRNRIYGTSGGQLWTVTSEGLEELRDGKWVLHGIPEIAN